MDKASPINNVMKKFIEEYDYNPDNNINFTSIIILVQNKLEHTVLCIESIRKFTPKDKYELIVVDNNSSDGTVSWIKEQNDITGIYNQNDVSVSKGYNQGIQISKGKNILILSNETILTPNWLNNLDKALYSNENIGAVEPVTNNSKNSNHIKVEYSQLDHMIEFAKEYNKSNNNLWHNKIKLSRLCYLIKREVIDKIGALDEKLISGDYESYDISLRILLEGYEILLCKDTFIHEMISTTPEQDKESNIINTDNNLLKLNEKWGFNLTYDNPSRLSLIEKISEFKDRKLNILEVGCGSGETLLDIKNIYKNANLYGVEKNRSSSDVAKTFSNTICADIETLEMPYEKEFFDYIILDEVIECLNDPWSVVEKIKKYLKKSGYIIVVISNLMHVSILKNLINGSFTYENNGILSYEHLRFFTLQDIHELFADNKFRVTEFGARVINSSTDEDNFIEKLCMLTSNEYKTQYSAYQYIFKFSHIIPLDEFI